MSVSADCLPLLRVRHKRARLSPARAWCALALPATLCLGPQTAWANPADTFGFGSRSSAMGGAVSAGVADTSANYYNPAGLAWANRTELSLGLVYFSPSFSRDAEPAALSDVSAWQLGLLAPGRFWGIPLAFGLGAQVSGRRIARVVTFTEDDQRWFVYEHRPEQLFLVSNLGLRLTPELSFGAGFGFLAATDGLMRITGTLQQPTGDTTQYDSELEHEVLAELSNVRYPQLGVDWRITGDVELALVYRGEGSVTLDVDSDIDGTITTGPLAFPTRYLLFSKTVQSWIPRQLNLGVRWAPSAELELHADVCWIDWSGLPSPVSATRSELSIDTRGVLFQIPELPPATTQTSARARDRLSPRLGAELRPRWGPLAWALRAGYAYQPTGLDAGSSPNLLDADAHVLSLGAGLRLVRWDSDAGLELNLHGQWSQLTEQTVRTGSGESSSLTGHWVAGGAALRLAL